jgi:glycosyltransferase involved in cell wall biosynthesis
MRIGLLTYALERAPGGIGRYTRELRDGLRRAGADVVLLEAGQGGSGTQSRRLPGAGRLPLLMTLGQAEIGWLARRERLDVVHDPTGTAPLLLTGARRVITVHDVVPYVAPSTSTVLDWLIYRLWLPLVAGKMDAIVTVSEHSRRDIVRHLNVDPSRVHAVPSAAGAHFRPVDRSCSAAVARRHGITGPYLLYVGSVEARKNLPRLLEAYARLRRRSTRWQLVVVGARTWKYGPVFETVRRLGLEPHVRFTGFVRDEELPALYSGADLFVFPSLYEGFGLPILEAMACGAPVITSACSSLPEVAGTAAILIDPLDVETLGDAIWRVLDDRRLADSLRQRGLARAAQFRWDRTVEQTLAVYRSTFSAVERDLAPEHAVSGLKVGQ